MRRDVITEATIDLGAIAHNTAVFAASTTAEVMAVVKANGFGHGALATAEAALAGGATWLGVATGAEALELRAAGVTAPILSWIHPHDGDLAEAVAADVDVSVSSVDHLASVASSGLTPNVHLKADTGLHRNGSVASDWPELVRRAREFEQYGRIRVRAVWSHLISGEDSEAEATRLQVTRFETALALARDAGLRPRLRHLANSVAALGTPVTHYDLVRPGIGLYGVEPDLRRTYGLRAAMTLRARLVLVKHVPAGSGVSYEHDYVTTRPTTLGLVPLGFADGVPRTAGPFAQVWCAGRRFPVAGRIAMDQFVVDFGEFTPAAGEDVVLFGSGADGEPTVGDWADWAGTIPHEIFTGIGARVRREHVGLPVPANQQRGEA
ncbi:alanine racemase [Amycolatopsis sp. GM8]|uniref:alanine racemase n=1 Tax=Amycolatopsis sp. GM8 TaxID=2896530 RepID=UPI001F02614D|nr:alanine racemase [Amycolatopsis sp. GM8]